MCDGDVCSDNVCGGDVCGDDVCGDDVCGGDLCVGGICGSCTCGGGICDGSPDGETRDELDAILASAPRASAFIIRYFSSLFQRGYRRDVKIFEISVNEGRGDNVEK